GIPPGLEDSQSGASLKRMLSGDHTIHAHDDRAPWPSFRPLLLLRDQRCSREEQGTSKENEIPFVRCHSYRSPWAPSSARAVMRCKFLLTNCTSPSPSWLTFSVTQRTVCGAAIYSDANRQRYEPTGFLL